MKRHGFTLIELLVVIVIVMLLVGLLLPAIYVITTRARAVECLNNMKGIGVAMNSWAISTDYKPVRPRAPGAPPEAELYFQNNRWTEQVHNNLYCWKTGGSDAPDEAADIVNMLYPRYITSGKPFYCPSFNRKTKADFGGGLGPIVYDDQNVTWQGADTTWWGYEWVNPRFSPMPAAWTGLRYGISIPGNEFTPNAVMFCHYSSEHAGALYADGSADSGKDYLIGTRPFGW